MDTMRPESPALLTDRDVDPSYFRCCGDEDLVFLRCPRCGHVMVFCCECDTLYPDLAYPSEQRPRASAERLTCPACLGPFEDPYFLRPQHVDRYLATAEEVRTAGFGHLIARAPRP